MHDRIRLGSSKVAILLYVMRFDHGRNGGVSIERRSSRFGKEL